MLLVLLIFYSMQASSQWGGITHIRGWDFHTQLIFVTKEACFPIS